MLVLMTLVVLGGATALLDRAETQSQVQSSNDEATAKALADAKAALIAWAVTYPAQSDGATPDDLSTTPGLLPFPDRKDAGAYDGIGDCVDAATLADAHLLGRFPTVGQGAVASVCQGVPVGVDLRDGAGEPLWYAVSRNLLQGGGGGPINPDISDPAQARFPWITVRNEQGNIIQDASGFPLAVAAVIIAPGRPLETQDRAGSADPDQYLDSVTIAGTTYSNADSDGCTDNVPSPCASPTGEEEFIDYSNAGALDTFNDQLIYITVNELMRAVEKRVLGEAEISLESYRSASKPYHTANGAFPWLAQYRSPRGLISGNVFVAGADDITVVAIPGNPDFSTAGIVPGDILLNVTDGSWAPVVLVNSPTNLSHGGLTGGTTNTFGSGDEYRVESSYKSNASVYEGALGVHLPNELFKTAFTGTWNFVDATPSSTPDDNGDPTLIPPLADVQSGTLNVTADNGQCMWARPDTVDCVGYEENPSYFRADLGTNVRREIFYSFSFVADTVTPVPSTAGDVRRRDVSINGGGPGALVVPTAAIAPLLPQVTWSVRIKDWVSTNYGQLDFFIEPDTTGQISLSGIRFDLSVVYDDTDDDLDEVPEWFVENGWHKFLYVALSPDSVAGGSPPCGHPAPGIPGALSDSCLTLFVNGAVTMNNIEALVISPGSEWIRQVRDTGEGDCDGDGVQDPPVAGEYRCAFFEAENTGAGVVPRHYGRNIFSTTLVVPPPVIPFNDQVRVLATVP